MSGSARILDRLRHGPATAAELYGLHCIVHSRIAELRKQGHVIVCTHTKGESGPSAYVYRLDASSPTTQALGACLSPTDSPPVPQPLSAAWPTDGSAAFRERPTGGEQLSLMEAAA